MREIMSAEKWDVEVGGVKHRVVVETDATTQRTSIRVDGRMAGRPLAATEEDRQFLVGPQPYLLRRMPDGTFDLDIAPGEPAQPSAAATQAPQKSAAAGNSRTVLAAVLLVVVVALGWWTWDSTTYLRVPWKKFQAPGGEVTIDFPGDPADESRDEEVDGETVRVARFTARYGDHDYVLEQEDMGEPIMENFAPKILAEEVRSAWGSAVKETSDTVRSGRDAVAYVADFPPTGEDRAVTMRGIVMVHQSRLYTAWVEVPLGEEETADVTRFLRSIKLPKEYAFHRRGARRNYEERLAEHQNRSEENKKIGRPFRMIGVIARLFVTIVAFVIWVFLWRSRLR